MNQCTNNSRDKARNLSIKNCRVRFLVLAEIFNFIFVSSSSLLKYTKNCLSNKVFTSAWDKVIHKVTPRNTKRKDQQCHCNQWGMYCNKWGIHLIFNSVTYLSLHSHNLIWPEDWLSCRQLSKQNLQKWPKNGSENFQRVMNSVESPKIIERDVFFKHIWS